jgi:hypothetical protein
MGHARREEEPRLGERVHAHPHEGAPLLPALLERGAQRAGRHGAPGGAAQAFLHDCAVGALLQVPRVAGGLAVPSRDGRLAHLAAPTRRSRRRTRAVGGGLAPKGGRVFAGSALLSGRNAQVLAHAHAPSSGRNAAHHQRAHERGEGLPRWQQPARLRPPGQAVAQTRLRSQGRQSLADQGDRVHPRGVPGRHA